MDEFFKQPQVIGPIIAVIGAAIIAPLIKKFHFDVQNCLRVEVRAWNCKTSNALKKVVGLDALRELVDPLGVVINANGYMTITIRNISRRKISEVTLTMLEPLIGMVLQVDNADEVMQVKSGQSIGVGDIQPKHSRVIHVWCNANVSDFNFAWFKQFLRVSADELDSVRLRFPTPRYLWKKNELRLVWIFNLVLFTTVIIGIVSGFIR